MESRENDFDNFILVNLQPLEHVNIMENEVNRRREERRHVQIDPEMLTQFSENIRCPICHNVFYEPVACGNCLNHFCSFCIQQTLKYTHKCPLCQQHKDFKEVRRAVPLLKNMLASLVIYCVNRTNGCNEQIRYDGFQKHIDQCMYQFDSCNFNHKGQICGQRLLRYKINEHQERQCPFRKINCVHCGEKYISKDILAHESECQEAILQCFKCLEGYQRKVEENHPLVCTQNFNNCKYCGKALLLLSLRQHEPECELSEATCLGCREVMQLSKYYDHQSVCQEFPMICPHCQDNLKRHQFANHSTAQCVSHVRQQSADRINQLEKKLEILEEKFQDQSKQLGFSRHHKDSDIYISPCKMIATVREQKKKRKDRFALLEPGINPQSLEDMTWTFRITALKSEWFAVGITDGASIYLQKRYQDLGHGSYLVSANGIIYSSHNPQANWQQSNFKMEQSDIIKVVYKPQEKLMNFNNVTRELNTQITLDNELNVPYYPCVCLRTAADQVQIIK